MMPRNNRLIKERERIKDVYDKYMSDSEFLDKHSGDNFGNQSISQERYHSIRRLVNKYEIQICNVKILEVGCAGGNTISTLLNLGAIEGNVHGIDIRHNRVNDARRAYPNARFTVMDAGEMDFARNSYDLVTTFALFSSIIDPQIRKDIASEIYRVLKEGGAVLYYDFRFNNPWNPNVFGINKNEINNIFPSMNKTLKSITVLPPLSRRLGTMTPILYPILSLVPFLRSHCLGILIK